ncbi:hypothetical protein F511_06169 [Dorcoceras hygrometricum]|uniref:Uncharacterized protein n=1 Tax=Dorcoceras hygrometricum TaxID=472368 RepID=A0A2Z7CLZ7_9LAMI|nr:hypothetical protein F511_06169 [Dorcoceras hygrometricum]
MQRDSFSGIKPTLASSHNLSSHILHPNLCLSSSMVQRYILLSNILVTLQGSRLLDYMPNRYSHRASPDKLAQYNILTGTRKGALPADALLVSADLREEPTKAKHKTKAAPKRKRQQGQTLARRSLVKQQSDKTCNILRHAMHKGYIEDSSTVKRVHNRLSCESEINHQSMFSIQWPHRMWNMPPRRVREQQEDDDTPPPPPPPQMTPFERDNVEMLAGITRLLERQSERPEKSHEEDVVERLHAE